MTINDPDDGYLLHVRPLRDTSLIGEFFLRRHGRVSVVYSHLKKEGRQGAKARLLQPFVPLAVTFDGRHELKKGRMLEAAAASLMLTGTALFSGMYLNELLVRLLHKEEAHVELFATYEDTLRQLQSGPADIPLRRFERHLLAALGYELVLDRDIHGDPVRIDADYQYVPDRGLIPLLRPQVPAHAHTGFCGAHLLEIHRHAYEDNAVRVAARQLSRLALAPHLGDKPLHSRELFAQLRRR